jgi:hypothetical protein
MPLITDEFGPKVSDVFSAEEINSLKTCQTQNGVQARFFYKGRTLNISTGRLAPKGTCVIVQFVYWNFDRTTAQRIAQALHVDVEFD